MASRQSMTAVSSRKTKQWRLSRYYNTAASGGFWTNALQSVRVRAHTRMCIGEQQCGRRHSCIDSVILRDSAEVLVNDAIALTWRVVLDVSVRPTKLCARGRRLYMVGKRRKEVVNRMSGERVLLCMHSCSHSRMKLSAPPGGPTRH